MIEGCRQQSKSTLQVNWAKWILILPALAFFTLFLLMPLLIVFIEAFRHGPLKYMTAIIDKEAVSALYLSLAILVVVVPLNTLFGITAAWSISKFRFRGRRLLITLIDLPSSISPVVVGLTYLLLFGHQGFWGDFFYSRGIKIIFAMPGMILVTIFITFPLVVRGLLPLMEAQGTHDEEAAAMLGACGLRTFWHVTLPNIKWGLLHGVMLCSARAMGEFGAVSVVSGHIRGMTNTLPLHIEILYNEYQFVSAYSVASVLSIFSLITLGLKLFFEHRDKAARATGCDF
ncbi:MAG: sulfate ABC transporter permease subunit CysW [Oligoflexales bacterium]|nr:sulfate ABC transporter permease subunit CysW [Oligoflexales bacterium]